MVAADINNVSCEASRKRCNWLGHVLSRGGESDCVTALDWKTESRAARGRPRTTWRRTVETGLDELEYGQNGSTKQSGLDRQRDGLVRLVAR